MANKIQTCSACEKAIQCMKYHKDKYDKYSNQDPYETFGCLDFDPYYDYEEEE